MVWKNNHMAAYIWLFLTQKENETKKLVRQLTKKMKRKKIRERKGVVNVRIIHYGSENDVKP